MKKIYSILLLVFLIRITAQDISFNKLYGNSDPNNYYLGHYPVSGSDGLNIKWHGGIKLTTGEVFGALQILGNGNVGIGTESPVQKLDVNGNLLLRNNSNYGGAGSFIHFTSFTDSSNGPKIRSSLEYASGQESRSSLILSSYYNEYKDELTLINGNVGVRNLNPQFNLDVTGTGAFSGNVKIGAKLEAKEIKVTTTPTADFVFEEDYKLPKLEDVETHIKAKKHLPEIASAKDMNRNGVNIGEFQIQLLKKIEELTLYSIEQNKQLKKQSLQIEILQEKIIQKN